MRRIIHTQEAAGPWSLRPLDIDPYQVPKFYGLQLESKLGRFFGAQDQITIGARSVLIKRVIAGRVMHMRRMPYSAFQGVAINVIPPEKEGEANRVTVFLHHEDESLSIPLYRAAHFDDVTARWQSWGKIMRLPLLAPNGDGTYRHIIKRLGKCLLATPFMRPARLTLGWRRGRFSYCRELGQAQNLQVVGGREIIARH